MRCSFPNPVGIIGTGSYVPDQRVPNAELAERVATSDAWIRDKLGISERRIAAADQATSDLAFLAGKRALEQAGLRPEDVDLIIVATATPDRLSPSTACLVQEKLGARNASAFDIAAVCSGFVYGLGVAAQLVSAGACRNALLIGADTFSRITNWNDRSCVFFGDGAGAVVVAPVAEGRGLLAVDTYADGTGKWNFTVPAGGSELPATEATLEGQLHTFRMNGRAVFETGTTVLPEAIERVLARCALTIADVDLLVPHQPSVNILKATADRLGLPFDKVITNMDRFANTAGASVPLALDEANRSGRLRDGGVVLFAAVGSGWTWGAALMRWSTASGH